MELSSIKSVDINAMVRVGALRGPLTTKCLSLNVGEGFEVKGKAREELQYALAQAKKEGMVLGTRKLGSLHFLIFRRS